jgi:integrase
MRQRHQEGRVEERGGKRKTWYGHYYVYVMKNGVEVRKHRGVPLGYKSELAKWEAEDKLRGIIARETGIVEPIKEDVTLRRFYEDKFEPSRCGGWLDNTRKTNNYGMARYVYPVLGDKKLREIDTFLCQKFMNELAKRDTSKGKLKRTASKGLVARTKTILWSLLDMARDEELLSKNPMAKVKMPKCQPTPKPILSPVDAGRLIRAITSARDLLILLLGVFGGPRASEIFGIQWNCYMGEYIEIRNTAYSGQLHKWRVKRQASFARIHLPKVVQVAFERWRAECPDTTPEALVFANPKTGRPLWAGGWLRNHLKPIALSLGITAPMTFQVLRRSCATRNQKHGSLKDVQTHLRHGSIGTTGDIYMMEIPDSVAHMVELDVADVMGRIQ